MTRITFDNGIVYIEDIGGAYDYNEAMQIYRKLGEVIRLAFVSEDARDNIEALSNNEQYKCERCGTRNAHEHFDGCQSMPDIPAWMQDDEERAALPDCISDATGMAKHFAKKVHDAKR